MKMRWNGNENEIGELHTAIFIVARDVFKVFLLFSKGGSNPEVKKLKNQVFVF